MCFDEWGPLEIRPIGGVAWAKRGQPARMRATYRRLQGTEQFFGFYDVHADCLDGVFASASACPNCSRPSRGCVSATRTPNCSSSWITCTNSTIIRASWHC